MSKIEITAGWTEAIAALLYNDIYDVTGEDEGAWNVKNRRDDAHYLAFAESLLKTIQGHPEASDEQVIALARAYAPSAYKRMTTGNPWAGSWSDTIVIDEQYSLLSSETKKHMEDIRGFMASPPVIAEEYEFILTEEIAAEKLYEFRKALGNTEGYEPGGVPLHYRDDPTGEVPATVTTYHTYQTFKAEDRPMPYTEFVLLRTYLDYYINAPCWKASEQDMPKLEGLRSGVKMLGSTDDVAAWLKDCLELGIDPL